MGEEALDVGNVNDHLLLPSPMFVRLLKFIKCMVKSPLESIPMIK